MKLLSLTLLALIGLENPVTTVSAEETTGEKIEAKGHDVKRGVKKTVHRSEEAFCNDSTLECGAKKVGNRVVEAKDATVDGVKKVKNKVD